jgi:hypothetical protein
MATIEDVRAVLDPDEPNYNRAKRLGSAALPALRQLIEGEDPMLASKATYLAALIGGDDAEESVVSASRHRSVVVRVAAAHGASLLKDETAERVLQGLMEDRDRRVTMAARRSLTVLRERR